MRLLHLTVTHDRFDVEAVVEVNGQTLTWRASESGRMVLNNQYGGEPAWWEFLASVLQQYVLDRYELNSRLKDEYDRGWRESSRTAREAESKRAARAVRRRGVYLYLLSRLGILKIGYSHDPRKRAASISSASIPPVEVIVLAKRRFGSEATAREAEKATHQRFATHRLHGEWFTDVPEIREFFGVRS